MRRFDIKERPIGELAPKLAALLINVSIFDALAD